MKPEEPERRRHPRSTYATTIEYALARPDEPHGTARGVTINISSTGLCLYLFKPVSEGQELKIFHGLFAKQHLSARVQWSHQLTGEMFKAGIHFLRASGPEGSPHPGEPASPP